MRRCKVGDMVMVTGGIRIDLRGRIGTVAQVGVHEFSTAPHFDRAAVVEFPRATLNYRGKRLIFRGWMRDSSLTPLRPPPEGETTTTTAPLREPETV